MNNVLKFNVFRALFVLNFSRYRLFDQRQTWGLQKQWQQQQQAYVLVREQGYLKKGLKRRVFKALWYPLSSSSSSALLS